MSIDCLIVSDRNWRNTPTEEVGSSLGDGEEIANLLWGQNLNISATGVARLWSVNLQRHLKRMDKSSSRSKTCFVDE